MYASCMNVPLENTLCCILETQWKLVKHETRVVCDTDICDKKENRGKTLQDKETQVTVVLDAFLQISSSDGTTEAWGSSLKCFK